MKPYSIAAELLLQDMTITVSFLMMHNSSCLLELTQPIRKNEIPCELLTLGEINLYKKVLENTTYELATTGSQDIKTALSNNTDLIPGVYEGGLKTWECSLDLLMLLAQMSKGVDMSSTRVLELGCGSGLPGVYMISCTSASRVDFQDYNEEVLTHVTIPNVVLNAPVSGKSLNEEVHPSALAQRSSFYSGDWSGFVQLNNPNKAPELKYDIVLTSETIYEPSLNKVLLATIKDSMAYPRGVALVAAKSYYFGVGGSMTAFQSLVASDPELKSETVYQSSEGVNREILQISFASA
ncbi:hypothetical protein SARC_01162 [Sphaeroforma arctica JP610]|uniref:protein-histidine N-methyltransferase n=1 Tax=Sphaeroforma arctica JP610 TaxID=667725 RepID=A0A0L0GCF8_9EUKA|nr:hypothetical protein SARC_01162 [Sphaeroforma arctica JP610]KNC86695.1 hypothetical protein SARC_01162 [Sphaeroforma arctica JP610]|eukprot:XP_014160597.1 hypothetical protein SARC_01162 [Sphaeroforma arctica JP610]